MKLIIAVLIVILVISISVSYAHAQICYGCNAPQLNLTDIQEAREKISLEFGSSNATSQI